MFSILYSLPYFIYKFFIGSSTDFTLALTTILLVRPLEKLLSILGYNVWSNETRLFFEDLNSGTVNSVIVAVECSGIYSMLIFICAFISYILITHNLFDRSVLLLLFLGIQMAYFANIFRMVVIVIVGHYFGVDALKWVHLNGGWLIFLTWIFIFWYILDKLLPQNIKNKT